MKLCETLDMLALAKRFLNFLTQNPFCRLLVQCLGLLWHENTVALLLPPVPDFKLGVGTPL